MSSSNNAYYQTVARTPESVPGYTERLEQILPFIGIRQQGKLSMLSNLCGLKPVTIKQRLDEDKPPRKEKHFTMLLEGCVALFKEQDKVNITAQALSDYLLFDKPLKKGLQKRIDKAYQQAIDEQESQEAKRDRSELAYTPTSEPGFSERLDTAVLYAGIRQGKLSKIARWLDKTVGGIKYMLDGDKPPSYLDDFNVLIDNLQHHIALFTGEKVEASALTDYLLHNEPSPFESFESVEALHTRDPITVFNKVKLGEIYLCIDEMGRSIGVDAFKELSHSDMELVIERSLFVVQQAGGELNSATREAVKNIVKAGKDGKL